MNKLGSILSGIFLVILLIGSSYTTYALINLSGKISESGISINKASAVSYRFDASKTNLEALPDMAGGC